ncbi:MAG: 3'-5' exoribonuclease YhaM family protein [Gemmatimonadales bacterium]
MPPGTDLKRLLPGERLQDSLLVLDVEQRTYGDGKDCVVLVLSNSSGSIVSAPFWSEKQSALAGIGKGTVVQVGGEVRLFRGRRQLDISSISILPGVAIDWRRLLPSIADVVPIWERLDRWRAGMRGSRLQDVVALFYDDADFRRHFQECPASTSGHHAELGGLLRHTCEVAAIGRAIAKTSRADPDLVLAGALLHDIGKLEAYSWKVGFGTTESGSLVGHVALGMLMLSRRVADQATPPCTERELLLLQHLIASHHGRLEFGAAVLPMTLEAEILHHADNASAKTASMADALADPDNFAGDDLISAKSIWQLDRRRAYRGSSDWGYREVPS